MKRLELIEWPGHVALMALGTDWMSEAHWADLATACRLCADLATDDAVKSLAQRGLDLLADESSDITEMKQVIGQIVQWVALQPNRNIHDAALKRLRELDEQERISKLGRDHNMSVSS